MVLRSESEDISIPRLPTMIYAQRVQPCVDGNKANCFCYKRKNRKREMKPDLIGGKGINFTLMNVK